MTEIIEHLCVTVSVLTSHKLLHANSCRVVASGSQCYRWQHIVIIPFLSQLYGKVGIRSTIDLYSWINNKLNKLYMT